MGTDARLRHLHDAKPGERGGGAVRDHAPLNQLIASQTALGRVGLPDDIGTAMAALLSDDLAWVNGQRIEVSGGIHL